MPTGIGGWRSDVPISMPRPLDGHGAAVQNNEALVQMYGFCFTRNGLFHNLSSQDLEAYTMAITAPANKSDNIVPADLDARKS